MSRALALFVGVSLALAPAAARAADEPKDILAKAIKAHGGEDALTKYKATQLKTKGKIDVPGVGEIEFTQETAYMIPDKFRDTMEFKAAGQNFTVFTLINGDKITFELNGKAMDLPDSAKDSLKDVGHLLQVGRLVPLKDKPYELSIIGEDKVEGKKVVGVRVSAKDKKDVSMYFDKETGLIAKIEYRTAEPMTGKEVTEERIIAEYGKDKNGIPTPKKVIVKHDGKQFLEAEILELTLLEKIDDSEFKK
jgi:hypothetical protein